MIMEYLNPFHHGSDKTIITIPNHQPLRLSPTKPQHPASYFSVISHSEKDSPFNSQVVYTAVYCYVYNRNVCAVDAFPVEIHRRCDWQRLRVVRHPGADGVCLGNQRGYGL